MLSPRASRVQIPNCKCGPPVCDQAGRVLKLRTCPACQSVRLDIIRGVEYAGAYVKGGDTETLELVRQGEFFSPQALYAFPLPGPQKE